jgi:hypothetical protein
MEAASEPVEEARPNSPQPPIESIDDRRERIRCICGFYRLMRMHPHDRELQQPPADAPLTKLSAWYELAVARIRQREAREEAEARWRTVTIVTAIVKGLVDAQPRN